MVGALKSAGLEASVLGKRRRRSGFEATQFNPVAAAGFRVSRPFPDKTILGVTG